MKTNFKKTLALLGAMTFMITAATACGDSKSDSSASSAAEQSAESSSTKGEQNVGVLSVLNLSEKDYAVIGSRGDAAAHYLMDKGLVTANVSEEATCLENYSVNTVYHDTLDSMIMALESGTLNSAVLPLSTAEYLCKNNDKLQTIYSIDKEKAVTSDDVNIQAAVNTLGTGYAFMFSDSSTQLRDDFDKAIDEMEADGTINKLVKEYIDDIVTGGEIKPVTFENNGSKTVKVAVTGCLPPMDYVAPDGTFAGFNTAILAEIGKRLGVNIELVQTDSVGRAAALSSGTADVVFWTRVDISMPGPPKFDEAQSKKMEDLRKGNTGEKPDNMPDDELMDKLTAGGSPRMKEKMDMPEGTIVTDPYFKDFLTRVTLK